MKTLLGVTLIGAISLSLSAISATAATQADKSQSRMPSKGAEAAKAITTITGVAISPLLGTGVVGAWDYFHTPKAERGRMAWYAHPLFWLPALLVVAAVAAKDIFGAAIPVGWKKPIDVAENIENKISGIVAAGAFVPFIAAIFHSSARASSAAATGADLGTAGLAMVPVAAIDLTPLLNVLTVPVGIVAFALVWLVSHVINVLILISPFGVVDGALKAGRTALLATLTGIHLANPWAGMLLSLIIIIVAYFVAGWSFRMLVCGSVFTWDFLTLRRRRFKPLANANWMFTARKIEKAPIRTYGQLVRGENGQWTFEYRPWLFMPQRKVTLPPGKYAVGRGLLYPEIMLDEAEKPKTMLLLPPRYKGHEEDIAHAYDIKDIRDVGLLKGFKAVWNWLKSLCGFGARGAAEPAPA